MKEVLILGVIGISAILILYSQKKQQTTVNPTILQPTTIQSTTLQQTTVNPSTLQPTTVIPTTLKTLQPTLEPTPVQIIKPKSYTNLYIGAGISGTVITAVGAAGAYKLRKYYENKIDSGDIELEKLEFYEMDESTPLINLRKGEKIEHLN
jgi:hypothetical protein